jgi:hypothetical protein
MRVNPAEKIIRKDELREALKQKTERITRVVALGVAFISVFMFVIKIMFL